ncbi:MAG: hypothetical protein ACLTW7_15470 [Enterococcus sp.]
MRQVLAFLYLHGNPLSYSAMIGLDGGADPDVENVIWEPEKQDLQLLRL